MLLQWYISLIGQQCKVRFCLAVGKYLLHLYVCCLGTRCFACIAVARDGLNSAVNWKAVFPVNLGMNNVPFFLSPLRTILSPRLSLNGSTQHSPSVHLFPLFVLFIAVLKRNIFSTKPLGQSAICEQKPPGTYFSWIWITWFLLFLRNPTELRRKITYTFLSIPFFSIGESLHWCGRWDTLNIMPGLSTSQTVL